MKKIAIALTLFVPFFVYAQTDFKVLGKTISNFNTNIVAVLGVLFLSVALVTFFFGVVRFILAQQNGEGDKAKSGKTFMAWGLVGLFVVFSVYGIIKFAQSSLGVGGSTDIAKPCTDFENGCSKQTTSGQSVLPSAPNTGRDHGTCQGKGGSCRLNNGGIGEVDCFEGNPVCVYPYSSGSNSQTGVGVPQNSISVCDGYIGGDGKCYSDTCPSGCVVGFNAGGSSGGSSSSGSACPEMGNVCTTNTGGPGKIGCIDSDRVCFPS